MGRFGCFLDRIALKHCVFLYLLYFFWPYLPQFLISTLFPDLGDHNKYLLICTFRVLKERCTSFLGLISLNDLTHSLSVKANQPTKNSPNKPQVSKGKTEEPQCFKCLWQLQTLNQRGKHRSDTNLTHMQMLVHLKGSWTFFM